MAFRRIRVAWRLLLATITGLGVVFVFIGILRPEPNLRLAGQALMLGAVLLAISFCNQYRERLRVLEGRLLALQQEPSTDEGKPAD